MCKWFCLGLQMLVSSNLCHGMCVHLLYLGATEFLLLGVVKMRLHTWPQCISVAMCSRGFCMIMVLMPEMMCLVSLNCNWETMEVERVIIGNVLLQLGFQPVLTLLLFAEISSRYKIYFK